MGCVLWDLHLYCILSRYIRHLAVGLKGYRDRTVVEMGLNGDGSFGEQFFASLAVLELPRSVRVIKRFMPNDIADRRACCVYCYGRLFLEKLNDEGVGNKD